MSLPRFKEIKFGSCPSSMSVSEYEECVRSTERRNSIKRFLNKLLDWIERK